MAKLKKAKGKKRDDELDDAEALDEDAQALEDEGQDLDLDQDFNLGQDDETAEPDEDEDAPKGKKGKKSKKNKKGKKDEDDEEEEKPSKYRARNDAYTGMLAISLFALIGGCALLFLDYQKYGEMKPKGQVERIVPESGEGPAPGDGTPQPPPDGNPPGGNPTPPGGNPPMPMPPMPMPPMPPAMP